MISRFFIDRPIFASVLSIVITLAGGVAIWTLPLAQFPQVSPPTVTVSCTYPGASAQVVAEAVAAPIEQQVNGVEGMMYMSSTCTNDGQYNLTVTFFNDVDVNMAQVLVQNRVSLAVQQLPDVIKQTGVTTRKRSPDILMGVALISPDRRYDQLYLSNYAVLQIKDELARLDGVGDVFLFGQRDYSMRVWVDPEKLAARNLTAADVAAAIREQNMPVAAGAVGQQPAPEGQMLQVNLSTLGRLSEPEEFEEIVIKATPDGRITRLKDVARVELGAKSLDVNVSIDGQPTVFLAIFQMPDANALETHDRVMAKMAELKQGFPEGLDYDVGFTTVPYTRESINEVFKTLRDAIILVAIVVLLFLQNWRSAIIPLVAVPVAIIGTFAAMAAFGFSLNNLTLFGLVLAIGIVVDDAIVVVEAVEHHIEQGMRPREATIKAMQQVSGPVIAVGLVLSAVFVPCAFISGITGHFFRQFALTIAVSTIISAFNSLTLSPALTAVLLRAHDKTAALPLPWLSFPLAGGWLGWLLLPARLAPWLVRGLEALPASWAARLAPLEPWLAPGVAMLLGGLAGALAAGSANRLLGAFFLLFNRGFHYSTGLYARLVGGLLRVTAFVLVVYGGLLGVTYWRFVETPRGFIPSQDMGYLMVNVLLPDSASMERTQAVINKIVKIAVAHPGVKHCSGIAGQSFVLNAFGSNFGSMFVNLKDYHLRRDPKLSSTVIKEDLEKSFAQEIDEAMIMVFPPPPIRGVGRSGGFMIMVEDRGDVGPQALQEETDNLVRIGNQTPGFGRLMTSFRANVPQLYIKPDPQQCMTRHVSLAAFADALRIYQGSLYVNDFNKFGRTWQVIVQAEPEFRASPDYISRYKVRNSDGVMTPLGSLATLHEVNGPLVLTRYNMHPAASINGAASAGVSSNQAIEAMQRLAEENLPRNMAYEWTDMSYLELLAGNTATVIFGFAVVMVFLVLAAQYESWSLPLAVILVVPMCLLSALIGVNLAKMDVNIFTRVGFVVLVGLASKNAILIVEFAKLQRVAGISRREATLEACRLRLRPIVMTSFAFILGVVPLIAAHGAGAEMRKALGLAVFSGMLGVTLFGLALTPVFFYSIDWLGESRVFGWSWLRRLSGFTLATLSLRPVRRFGVEVALRVAASARKRSRPAPARQHAPPLPAAPTNGAAGNGSPENGSPGAKTPVPMSADETVILADETHEAPAPLHSPRPAAHLSPSAPRKRVLSQRDERH
ncbi:MAG TPA: efflux RND transporter permease subunit [Pirellulales bacterium]|nr:efflux RND transporter permease subunit [Pirellulales bacterium]